MRKDKIGFLDVLRSSGSPKIKFIKLIDHTLGSCLAFATPKKLSLDRLPEEFSKMLVVRPGGIGDALFLLPILRSLKAFDPSCKIDILCENRNAQVFLTQRNLCHTVYRYDNRKSFFSVVKNSYDVIVDTEQWHYLSALTARFIRSNFTVGFATRPLRNKLFDRAVAYEIDAYELENFIRLFQDVLSPAALVPGALQLEGSFKVDSAALTWVPKENQSASVTFSIGASIPERRLTKAQCLEIIRYILGKNSQVILLGGRDVQKAAVDILKDVSDPRVHNYVGTTTLQQSAALIKTSRLFIGPDSGLMHLACAVGTPVVAIFGPGNVRKWQPRKEKHCIITINVTCSPCTYFGYTVPTCQGSFPCMRNIKAESILAAIDKTL